MVFPHRLFNNIDTFTHIGDYIPLVDSGCDHHGRLSHPIV